MFLNAPRETVCSIMMMGFVGTSAQLNFSFSMRKWVEDHVCWTFCIIVLVQASAAFEAAAMCCWLLATTPADEAPFKIVKLRLMLSLSTAGTAGQVALPAGHLHSWWETWNFSRSADVKLQQLPSFHNMRFKWNLQPEAALCKIYHPATFFLHPPSLWRHLACIQIIANIFLNVIHFASYSCLPETDTLIRVIIIFTKRKPEYPFEEVRNRRSYPGRQATAFWSDWTVSP